MCDTVEPSFVHWLSLITKAATVLYYHRRGSVPEHTKYEATNLILFLLFFRVINVMNVSELMVCIVLTQKWL